MKSSQTTALALFSGGLDSTLASRVVTSQGIKVVAVKFVTPFFGYELLAKKDDYIRKIKETASIELILKDVTIPYLEMLKDPAHGYGRNFNPCIDCKIFLLKEAKKMMQEFNASFLITGEVVGQRPMSQRRDTLRTIERESGCENILVRPLCAKNLQPTQAELNGLIDREQLLDFSGRNRKPQMQLAERFDITEYPSPAGGCILTDPILSLRIRNYYEEHEKIVPEDVLLLLLGRQFKFPSGGWLVVGRNKQENNRLESQKQPGDWMLRPDNFPGPTVILRYSQNDKELQLAASILVRYSKKAISVQGKFKILAEKDGKVISLDTVATQDNNYLSWQKK
ncbi:MAG: thiamine biosynthesis protein [Deltaproteobacteria bacterium]|jgi:tRNA U34 2-thiouridine synthase MnmA/TrmU|nr:thiamine biosynthesis protein [Deltaproteobacteria bacterium]